MSGSEVAPPLAGRLRRAGEMLIGLSGSPLPTHVFQTLAEQAETVVPHDYMAICLEDADQQGYLVHTLSGGVDEPVGGRVFSKEGGSPGAASVPDAPTWSVRSTPWSTAPTISTASWHGPGCARRSRCRSDAVSRSWARSFSRGGARPIRSTTSRSPR
jgi:hypothetical protein